MHYWFEPQWNWYPVHGYYYKVCHYQPPGSPPWVSKYFYVVYYYNSPRSIYFYCFDPFSTFDTMGAFWCRCPSPLHPQYDPSWFSVLAPWSQSHDIDQCDPYFPPFAPTPACFPGTNMNLPQLPANLP